MTPAERSRLIDSLLDGEISEADFLRIEAELLVDSDVRAEYYDRLKLQLLLEREAADHAEAAEHAEATASRDATTTEAAVGRADLPTRRAAYLLTAAALLTLAASLLVILPRIVPSDADRASLPAGPLAATALPAESKAKGFALLGGQSDAVWDGPAVESGSLLPAGTLKLISGLAHIELFSGVQMVVEGRAEFSIESPMEVRVARGRVRAYVPDAAKGFRVLTDQGEVIDLGTEFAIDVGAAGTRVDVLDGEVELRHGGSEAQRVLGGQSQRLTAAGIKASTDSGEVSIVSPQEFHRSLDRRLVERVQRWQQRMASLRTQSDPIAYYRTDPADRWSRRWDNIARLEAEDGGGTETLASDGAIVAARRTPDRWGRPDAALDFSRTGSRVRVDVPGQYQNLTLITWVKINSLDRWYNSLFLTDGHERFEPHWQMMNDGRLFFSVKARQRNQDGAAAQHIFYSPPIWDASLGGQWIMLAVVYDTDAQRVTHYVDGKAVSREAIPADHLVDTIRIGAASIGNWSEPMYRTDPEFVVRNLNGSMDEFAMFAAALSDEQILNWYQAGNPHE